jgi:hypothetical protein
VKPGLDEFSADLFAGHKGARFVFVPPDSTQPGVELELIEVNGRPRNPGGGDSGEQHFALLFRSVEGRTLGPGLHTLTHDAFAPTPLFVERVHVRDAPPTAVFYEAIIFRRTRSTDRA